MIAFADRVGAVLVAPRAALRAVAAREGGGLRDALVLLGVGILALHAPALAGEAAVARLDLRGGLAGLGRVFARAAGLDLALILAGSLALSLTSPRGRRDSARDVDLAACAWVPSLALRAVAALAALAGAPAAAAQAATALGWAWSAALLLMAARAIRS